MISHSLAMFNDAWRELIHITSRSAQVVTAYISPGKLVIIVCSSILKIF